MLLFKQFSKELMLESIRQGLPHITTMNHEQTSNLVKHGKIHLSNMTEKTDGMNMKFGHDENGFYTQSTGSGNEKMRNPEDYETRARLRAKTTGKPLDLTASKAFGHIHATLANNTKLRHHLTKEYKKRGKEIAVHGEMFYKNFGKPTNNPNEIKFVGTSYDTRHMGHTGKFIIHSQLPINTQHDIEHFKKHLSDEHINFDDDKIEHPKTHVNIENEAEEVKGLNHSLLSARTTKTNKEAKLAEQEKLNKIQQKISKKVDDTVKGMKLTPKWGSGSEGIVIHPSDEHPDAPRFKVTSDTFRSYRASDAAKWKKP